MKMKRTMAWVLLTVLLVMSPRFVFATDSEIATTFRDVKAGHWAKAQIEEGVQKGYVSGFPDGTFRPEQKVSRAEFIRMLVDALKLPHVEQGTPWYQPYVAAVIETGIHRESDFKAEYDQPLTRLEMVRLAVRATNADLDANPNAKDDNWLVFRGTETGILAGVGAGKLDLQGTSTRAQAVAIIERILSVKAGKKLAVDKYAMSAAELAWHRTNLFTVTDMFDVRNSLNDNVSRGIDTWHTENLVLKNELFSAELDELIAVRLDDANDPNRKLLPAYETLRTEPEFGQPVPKDGIVLIFKYHTNYNRAPKIYTGQITVAIDGFKQPSDIMNSPIVIPLHITSTDSKYDWLLGSWPDTNGNAQFAMFLPNSGYTLTGPIRIGIYAMGYAGAPSGYFLSSKIVN
jgi:hypothetical protein